MNRLIKIYNNLMEVSDFGSYSNEEALDYIGKLVDISGDIRKVQGLEHALEMASLLETTDLNDEEYTLLEYFKGNAWANKRKLLKRGTNEIWNWEQEEIDQEIIALRKALKVGRDAQVPQKRICQILTNLGNLHDEIGRFVDAIEYWNEALKIDPGFGMALGNRGHGLFCYSLVLYDGGHKAVFLRQAYKDMQGALKLPLEYDAVGTKFQELTAKIEKALDKDFLDSSNDLEGFTLGESDAEVRYRNWCLENVLFLNPLNDLGDYSIGARDVLSTPSITVDLYEPPSYQGFFNQIKQEYISARYLYYEGIVSTEPHFADKGVLLLNTLDYPEYSIALEKEKVSFRMAYSILDKLGYFLNDYLRLSIRQNRVSLRTLWYKKQNNRKGLRDEFVKRENWPLRGLFWLSKDLYERKSSYKEVLNPDAQEIALIRNHIEHKYLKIHSFFWGPNKPEGPSDKMFKMLYDSLAYSVNRTDFEEKALRLLKIARSAIIYLSLAIHVEEKARERLRNKSVPVGMLPMDILDDDWKR